MTGGKVPEVNITARQVYVLCGLALVGCVFIVFSVLRGLYWVIEHVRWVP